MCLEAMINFMTQLFLLNPLIQISLCAFKTSLQYDLQDYVKIKL